MIFSCPRAFMVACDTILGSWQDILRKTFLALGNQTIELFCQHLSVKACFAVCLSRAVLGHKQTKQLPLALPTTLLIAARAPWGHVPAPLPAPSSSFLIFLNCKSPVLGEGPSLSGCEGNS